MIDNNDPDYYFHFVLLNIDSIGRIFYYFVFYLFDYYPENTIYSYYYHFHHFRHQKNNLHLMFQRKMCNVEKVFSNILMML
jgi:hypothetical protein